MGVFYKEVSPRQMKNRDPCSNHSDDSSFNYSDEYDPFDDRGTDLDFDVC